MLIYGFKAYRHKVFMGCIWPYWAAVLPFREPEGLRGGIYYFVTTTFPVTVPASVCT